MVALQKMSLDGALQGRAFGQILQIFLAATEKEIKHAVIIAGGVSVDEAGLEGKNIRGGGKKLPVLGVKQPGMTVEKEGLEFGKMAAVKIQGGAEGRLDVFGRQAGA